jgi:hypothetical protein
MAKTEKRSDLKQVASRLQFDNQQGERDGHSIAEVVDSSKSEVARGSRGSRLITGRTGNPLDTQLAIHTGSTDRLLTRPVIAAPYRSTLTGDDGLRDSKDAAIRQPQGEVMGSPFSRSAAIFAAISAAIAAGMSRSFAHENIGAGYKSRGHGRGAYSGKNKGNVCTNWLTLLNGQTNGKRECARRMRQMKSSG